MCAAPLQALQWHLVAEAAGGVLIAASDARLPIYVRELGSQSRLWEIAAWEHCASSDIPSHACLSATQSMREGIETVSHPISQAEGMQLC